MRWQIESRGLRCMSNLLRANEIAGCAKIPILLTEANERSSCVFTAIADGYRFCTRGCLIYAHVRVRLSYRELAADRLKE
ncbi:hypothetical protein ABC425_08385 [Brucella melitensis]|uniref:hypothetical protein n=1 Tax=Brucella melitensis TaxID=29459 RepID=UPI0031FDC814